MRSWIKKIVAAPLLYFLFMKIRPFTRKNTLLLVCTVALVSYSLFSCAVIARLKAETTGITKAYSELIQMAVSESITNEATHKIIKRILSNSINPVVLTDTLWHPVLWNNIVIPDTISGKKKLISEKVTQKEKQLLEKKIRSLKKSFTPLPVYSSDDHNVLAGYLVYGNSILMRGLFIMPFLEIGIAAAFIIVLYLVFHNIRINERSNLWVGLAKETAHQLGTPLSSVMGWIEYMRSSLESATKIDVIELSGILNNMDSDLNRLARITSRFSQIGSYPAMVPCDLREILTDVSSYFQLRLPLFQKRVRIEYDFNRTPLVHANRDLLEWVFENLLKNAIDAVTGNNGIIRIGMEHIVSDNIIRIQISDNGKGISWESHKKVFSPGFTTKRHGWGLGLTLAKRIIEDYHRGMIYVKWSQKEKGTTFNVDLPVSTQPDDTISFS